MTSPTGPGEPLPPPPNPGEALGPQSPNYDRLREFVVVHTQEPMSAAGLTAARELANDILVSQDGQEAILYEADGSASPIPTDVAQSIRRAADPATWAKTAKEENDWESLTRVRSIAELPSDIQDGIRSWLQINPDMTEAHALDILRSNARRDLVLSQRANDYLGPNRRNNPGAEPPTRPMPRAAGPEATSTPPARAPRPAKKTPRAPRPAAPTTPLPKLETPPVTGGRAEGVLNRVMDKLTQKLGMDADYNVAKREQREERRTAREEAKEAKKEAAEEEDEEGREKRVSSTQALLDPTNEEPISKEDAKLLHRILNQPWGQTKGQRKVRPMSSEAREDRRASRLRRGIARALRRSPELRRVNHITLKRQARWAWLRRRKPTTTEINQAITTTLRARSAEEDSPQFAYQSLNENRNGARDGSAPTRWLRMNRDNPDIPFSRGHIASMVETKREGEAAAVAAAAVEAREAKEEAKEAKQPGRLRRTWQELTHPDERADRIQAESRQHAVDVQDLRYYLDEGLRKGDEPAPDNTAFRSFLEKEVMPALSKLQPDSHGDIHSPVLGTLSPRDRFHIQNMYNRMDPPAAKPSRFRRKST